NVGSALFGGLPATGAIARTATNIRAGARSPVSGMLHAGFLLLFLLLLAPLMGYVPLAALAAVLLVVAWNMSEVENFRATMSAPIGDRVVLLLTFGLTVFFDLTVAIQAGIVVAALVFMYRMAEAVEVSSGVRTMDDDLHHDVPPMAEGEQRRMLPPGVEAYQITGPLFFGAANRLDSLLDRLYETPKVFILRMRVVPMIDASGVHALKALVERCRRKDIVLIISGLQPQPNRILVDMDLREEPGRLYFVSNFERAVALARSITGRDRPECSGPPIHAQWRDARAHPRPFQPRHRRLRADHRRLEFRRRRRHPGRPQDLRRPRRARPLRHRRADRAAHPRGDRGAR